MNQKFGSVQRLNPPIWKLLSANDSVCADVDAVNLAFHEVPPANWEATNKIDPGDIDKAAAVYKQYEADRVIETVS